MSLLNVTVKKARLVGAQAVQWNCYATLKLQHVKSTTVTVKGPNPCWEQDFLFEINYLDAGLLIEVWNKGLIWDKAVGYHWLHLRDIHHSNLVGAGQWLSLDAEVVMQEGEVVGTKTPTGHCLLLDARFELPSGDMETDDAVELQNKLEMLNSMLDQEARAEQARRQHQYYIQCEGVSEDSDYTSDVNYPVGQHPNSSASQFLSAANLLATPQRSLDSSRDNSYEKEDGDYRTNNSLGPYQQHQYLAPYQQSPVNTSPRPPRKLPQAQQRHPPRDNYETEPLYYNSRPQSRNYKAYNSYDQGDSWDDGEGYGYNRHDSSSSRPQYSEDYDDAQARIDYPPTSTATSASHNSASFRNGRRGRTPSLERQETIYDGAVGDYLNTEETRDYINDRGYSSSIAPKNTAFNETNDTTSIPIRHRRQLPIASNSTPTQLSQNTKNKQYNSTPAISSVTNNYDQYSQGFGNNIGDVDQDTHDSSSINPAITIAGATQASTRYNGWNNARDQDYGYSSNHKYTDEYPAEEIPIAFPVVNPQQNHKPNNKSRQLPQIISTNKDYTPSQDASFYDAQPPSFKEDNNVISQESQSNSQYVDQLGYENFDYTTGYYDESGNWVLFEQQERYAGYYDESGNWIVTDTHLDEPLAHQPLQEEYYPTEQTYDTSMDYYDEQYYDQNGEPYDLNNYYEEHPPPTAKPSGVIEAKPKLYSQQSNASVDYNYAYQSAENLSPTTLAEKEAALEAKSGHRNSISRRASFRRQASTRDYSGQDDTVSLKPPPQPSRTQESMDLGFSVSMDETKHDRDHYSNSGWTSGEYLDAESGITRRDSYDQYVDARQEQLGVSNEKDAQGPVHMDSLESNTSETAATQDPEQNEKFEAQYWQRQRDRIGQASMSAQNSIDYPYGYDPIYSNGAIPELGPQILEPMSPSTKLVNKAGLRLNQQSIDEGDNWTRDNSLEHPDVWSATGSRQGSFKLKKDVSRQDSFTDGDQEDDEYLIGDETGRPLRRPSTRKESSLSIDSQGGTLPPTSPPPIDEMTKNSSIDDETIAERKSSLDVPGKDKGPKTVSFDEEPPKVHPPERLTKGMTPREKWLWSMNRICSQLGVSRMNYLYYFACSLYFISAK